MPIPIAEKALSVLEKGLKLWETFIATRQGAYERKQDKNQVKAIESAEKAFFVMDNVITCLKVKGWDTNELFKGDLKVLARYRKRFFHYH